MNRQQKADLVQGLSEKFMATEASFIVNCQGLTVAQMQNLRLALESKNSEIQVAKNRLVRIAIQGKVESDVLREQLVGQNAIVFAKSDLTGTAKVLYDFARANEDLKIVAGCYDSRLLDKAAVTVLASLPSREVLIARLFGTMMAPITALAIVLKQIAEKSQSENSPIGENTENL